MKHAFKQHKDRNKFLPAATRVERVIFVYRQPKAEKMTAVDILDM